MKNLREAAGLLYSGPEYTRHDDGDLRVSDRYREAAQIVSGAMLDIAGWTTEKPTQPGWYWWRFRTGQEGIVLGVVLRFDGDLVSTTGTPIERYEGEFAGPIPEPVESK